MSATDLIVIAIVLPLFGMVASFITCHRGTLPYGLAAVINTLLLGTALALVFVVDLEGTAILRSGSWDAKVGILLVADRLSTLMLAVSALIAWAVSIYEIGEAKAGRGHPLRPALMQAMLLGINGAFLTGDLFNLYVWFEVMLMASFALLVLGRTQATLRGALPYLLLNLLGSALFLIGAGLVYGKVGTLNMAELAVRLAESPEVFYVDSSGVLLLVAFALKAGVFPFFFWLPDSYPHPPIPVIALFAGLLTKVGLYTLIRSYTLFFATAFAPLQDILLILAALTMILGVLGAAAHFEIKRILSFHIISQIGYMLFGLALMTVAGLAACVFYIVHHIIVKSNLFLIGGIIEQKTGSTDLSKTGGLYRVAPFLGIVFLIPALSLGGIPPLSGFWAKLSLIQAGIGEEAWLMIAVSLIVGIFTLFSMTKIWGEAFWKARPDTSPPLAKASQWSYAPVVLLSIATLVMGFFGNSFFELAERTAEDLISNSGYILAVLGETTS